MSRISYLKCDACGDSDPHDQKQEENFVPIDFNREIKNPYESQFPKTETIELHFCVRCFSLLAKEMHRTACNFEKWKDARLQGAPPSTWQA